MLNEADLKAVREDVESYAWKCSEWPDWLFKIVAETEKVADRLDMSSEQAHGYAALAAITAYLSTVQAVPVTVKQLEWAHAGKVPDGPWSDTLLRQSRGHHNLGRYAGSYSVQEIEAGGKWGWRNTWTSDREPEGVEATEDKAKAAAQADFDARIRSVITNANGWRSMDSAPKGDGKCDGPAILVHGGSIEFDASDNRFPSTEVERVNWSLSESCWIAGYYGGHDMFIRVIDPLGWQPLPAPPASALKGGE